MEYYWYICNLINNIMEIKLYTKDELAEICVNYQMYRSGLNPSQDILNEYKETFINWFEKNYNNYGN